MMSDTARRASVPSTRKPVDWWRWAGRLTIVLL